MTDLLIFPYNGNGLEALACLTSSYNFLGFIDDDVTKQGKSDLGFEVFSREALVRYGSAKVLVVPGSPSSYIERDGIIKSLHLADERLVTLIHPTVQVSPYAEIGKNVLLMANVVISAKVKIGNHVCILPNTVIHHDSEIGECSLIGSNVVVAGYSKVGRKCYVGSGSNVINNVTIGDDALIGMGTNVIDDVKPKSKVVGNPMRYI